MSRGIVGLLLVCTIISIVSLAPRTHAQNPIGENPVSRIYYLIFPLCFAYLLIKMYHSVRRTEQKLGTPGSQETTQKAPSKIVLTVAVGVFVLGMLSLILAFNAFSSDPIVSGWLIILGLIGIVLSSYILVRNRTKRPTPTPTSSLAAEHVSERESEDTRIYSESASEETSLNVYCRYCGSENESDAFFCQKCGKLMSGEQTPKQSLSEVFCTQCGTKNKRHAAYCKKCGKKIPET